MSMKVCVLASGSRGNCTLVQSEKTKILIDAGLSGRETALRLSQIGLRIEELDGIIVGHEHTDHVRGLDVLARKFRRPVFMNRGTADAVAGTASGPWELRVFTNGQAWTLGDLTILPFSVFHDAQDPVGFSIQQGQLKVVAATDLGMATTVVKEKLKSARVVIMEANHDRALLLNGSRPWSLKQRIQGNQGHLANEDAAELIARETGDELSDVFLAHLSQDCNRPHLVLKVVGEKLKEAGKGHVRVWLTYPERISQVVELTSSYQEPARTAPSPFQPTLPGL